MISVLLSSSFINPWCITRNNMFKLRVVLYHSPLWNKKISPKKEQSVLCFYLSSLMRLICNPFYGFNKIQNDQSEQNELTKTIKFSPWETPALVPDAIYIRSIRFFLVKLVCLYILILSNRWKVYDTHRIVSCNSIGLMYAKQRVDIYSL